MRVFLTFIFYKTFANKLYNLYLLNNLESVKIKFDIILSDFILAAHYTTLK